MQFPQIQIETLVAAPVSKVWTYWTEPKHITQWNFAIPEWHCPSATNDLKVGGRYSARMEARDKSFGFDFEATYNEIVSNKRIVYTMDDGRKATTTFEALGNKTRVTTVFDAEEQNSKEIQQNGWQSILNNFKKYTEEN